MVNDSLANGSQVSPPEQTPYSSIWLRNVFDLKPTPPPTVEAAKPAEPPPNVHLTGITTILGKRKAMFMVQKKQEPGKPASQEESYILSEGQREGSLEVLEINTKASEVKIRLEDTISTIRFETNKMSGGGAAAGGGVPPQRFSPSFGPGHGGNPFPNRSAYPSPTAYSPAPTPSPQNYDQGGGFQPGGFSGGYSQPNNSAASTPAQAPAPSIPSLPANLPTDISPPNVTDQERALIAAAEKAIQSGNLSGNQTTTPGNSPTPTSSGSVPSLNGLNSGNIPPLPTTLPPPLPDR